MRYSIGRSVDHTGCRLSAGIHGGAAARRHFMGWLLNKIPSPCSESLSTVGVLCAFAAASPFPPSLLLPAPPVPAAQGPSGHPAANAHRPIPARPLRAHSIKRVAFIPPIFTTEGCFFFRRRLSRDKSNRLRCVSPTKTLSCEDATSDGPSWKSKVKNATVYAYYTGVNP